MSQKSDTLEVDKTYRTFLLSATCWREFANNPKTQVDEGLTWAEARAACQEFNDNRTAVQREAGTMMEFERE